LPKKIGNKLGFGKKEEGKGKEKEEDKVKIPDGPVGKPVTFKAPDEGHRLWIELKGGESVVMVASTPTSAANKLNAIAGEISKLPEGQRARAQALIETGFALLNETRQEADQQVENVEKAVSRQDVDAARSEINQRISSIDDTLRLAHVFQELFEILFNFRHQDGKKREIDEDGNTRVADENYDAQYATQWYHRELQDTMGTKGIPMKDAEGNFILDENGRSRRHERPYSIGVVVDEKNQQAHFGMSAAGHDPELKSRQDNRHEQMDVAYSNLDRPRADGSCAEIESHSRANCAEHEAFDKALHTREQNNQANTHTFEGLTDDSAYGRAGRYRHKPRCRNCQIMYPKNDRES
jgi:hypothetical protein